MPKFKIGGSYGYVGTDWEEEIEADSIEQAREWAWDQAVERVESWAMPVEEQDEGDDDEQA